MQFTISVLKQFSNCAAFVIGETAQSIYIIVFIGQTSNRNATNIANTIFEQSNKEQKIIVLLHKLSDLYTKQVHMQRFFDHVLKHGKRICFDKTAYPFLAVNTAPERDMEADKKFWLKCLAVAQFNIQAAKDSEHLEVELYKIALLHTACVQIALGLIRVCMEYTPNEFGLNYLLNICGYFTDMPTNIFNQQTPENERRYKMLCAPPSLLNHWTKLHAKESDFSWLLDACEQFLDQANKLVDKKFETLT